MQTASTTLVDKLKQSHDINSSAQVIAEWNMNRFATIKNVTNSRTVGTATLNADNTVVTSVAHGLAVHDRVMFSTITSSTPVVIGVIYYVLTVPTATTVTLSTTFGGAVIDIVGTSAATTMYALIEDYDEEMFPIESIVLPDRPTYRGNLKGRAATREVYTGAGADSWTNSGYEDTPRGARYSTANVLSKYKYWTSPLPSDGAPSGSPAAMQKCSPTVMYTAAKSCNKVLVSVDSSYSEPSAFTIQITSDGISWTTISTTPAIPDSGRIELYRQTNGTWSGTPDYAAASTSIMGIRLNVTQLNKAGVYFNLIEMSARLQADLSTYLVDFNINNAMSETSFVTPLGTASANAGSLNLSNTDGTFTNDNVSSPYYGLLDKNVEFRISEGTNIGTYAVPNFELIRLATMRSDKWSGQDLDVTGVNLFDDYVRLSELKPNPVFFQEMTVGEIIWRLLDSVGMVNYKYESRADDPSTLIPYFWTDGTKTLADIFNELTQATQTAVFFDEYNILQIRTRTAAYDLTKVASPTWIFNAEPSGTTLPDVVNASKVNDFEANVVNTSYAETKLAPVSAAGIPVMENVWEPEGDVVLRAAALKSNMTTTSTYANFDPRGMKSWPFTGIIQVEGEFMRYTRKGYSYYNAGGVLQYVWVKSNDERIAYDKVNPALAYKNYYNGNLYFGLANRGLWSSVPKAHYVELNGWTGRYRTSHEAVYNWMGGIVHDKNRSVMSIRTNKTFTPNAWYCVLTGSSYSQMPLHYGTRLWFPANGYSGTGGSAGMVIGASTNDSGYFIELNRTVAAGNRKWTNELCFYVRYPDGSISRIAGKGIAMAVGVTAWFDMDVTVSYPGSGAIRFSISINGIIKWTVTVAYAQRHSTSLSGRWGMFVRGWTHADFEYAYSSRHGQGDPIDDEGYFDRISGGYMSSQLMTQWVYSTRLASRIVKKKRVAYYQKYNSTTIDEFGPIAHEVREYDVKFSKTPILNSNLYFSNTTQVICPEYNSDPFGAKFIVANTARRNAIVSGEDTLMFGVDNAVNQKMLIYGRTVTPLEAKILTVRNELGIRKRGEVAVDVSSPWIQSEAAAKALGDWIVLHWSRGADEVVIEAFGNPLIQLGDVVSVNYPLMDMLAGTHKYFVVKVDQSYDTGLSTSVTLRRVTSNVPEESPPLI